MKTGNETLPCTPHTAFAGFTPETIVRLRSHGTEEYIEAGTILIERGERDLDVFVVLAGALEVYDCSKRRETTVAWLEESQFTGELDLFDNRRALMYCRAATRSHVLRISRHSLQQVMRRDSQIAEIIMHAIIGRRFDMVRHAVGGVTLVGHEHSSDTIRLQRFLTRNVFPFRLLAAETDSDADILIRGFELAPSELPIVLLPDQRILRNPSNAHLADELGITDPREHDAIYDVAIAGAGPAGLAAAVCAASEGLSTIVIEAHAPGGQAGTSSRIENYLGFPVGVSGQDLSERSLVQARRFGAHFAVSREVLHMTNNDDGYTLGLEDNRTIHARTVVIATGAEYQRLSVPNSGQFEYQGIHYAATSMEAGLCRNEDVVVVGAGNSAGQAALFMAQTARRVYLLVRGAGLRATMSAYLVQRILSSRTITLLVKTEIVGMNGDDRLCEVTWHNQISGETVTRDISNVFVMVGARPKTTWLSEGLALDANGFIVTGAAAGSEASFGTSLKGVFAVGDVRAGSVKRVASAVGEGSVVVSDIHKYLASQEMRTFFASESPLEPRITFHSNPA